MKDTFDFDPWADRVPTGVELHLVSEPVDDDLAGDDDLRDLIGGRHPEASVIFEARAHVPRIRPVLVALAARSAGATDVDSNVQHIAEMLHLALAVHDLALGREGGRRRRVARKLIKRSVGWLGGNHLTLRALEIATHATPEAISGELLDTLREFSDGQALARDLQKGAVPTEQDWLDHADSHTGALFAFCCRAGGHLAGRDPAKLSALGRYGRHLGRLWHIAEDAAGIRHDDGASHLLTRALAGRPVLPVIKAEDPRLGELWAELVRDPRRQQAEEIVRRVWAAEGLRHARAAMAREGWAARRALSSLDDSRYRRAMEQLAITLVRPPS